MIESNKISDVVVSDACLELISVDSSAARYRGLQYGDGAFCMMGGNFRWLHFRKVVIRQP